METWKTPLPSDWEGYWTDYELLKGRELSPRTLASYRDSLVYLGRFLEPEVPPLADLNKRQLAAYLDHTHKTTSATTTALRFRGLAAFINWLAKPGEDDEPFLDKNPIKGLRPPKVTEEPVEVLSKDEVRKVLAACKGQDFDSRRDEALIRMLYDTGCRRGEIQSMRIEPAWLNLRDGTAMVTGKTGPRVVAYGPSTGAALHRYLRLRQHRAPKTEQALWIGHKGALLGNGIYQILKRRFSEAKVETKERVHVFRHTFSHEWRKAGGGIDDLIALNGWKSPAMALRYGKSAAAARARDAHHKYSPGERL